MSTYEPIGLDQTTKTYAKTLEDAFNAAGCVTKSTTTSNAVQLEVTLKGKKETLQIKPVSYYDSEGNPEGLAIVIEPPKTPGINFIDVVEAYAKKELAEKSINHNTKAIVKKVKEKLAK